MSPTIQDVLDAIPSYEEKLRSLKELVLANAVLIGEIPSPTFGEADRIRFLNDRFTECGLSNAATDEAGNGIATIPGSEGSTNTLLIAHADTVFNQAVDHAMAVGPDKITGPGIADNTLGLAAVASLPTLLEKLDIKLKNNVILMGTTRSLGRGDLGGMRHFLDSNKLPIQGAICVEGAQLGRLSYSSIGMLRGEIQVEIPDQTDWSKWGNVGAITILNRVINKLLAIPLPSEPRTNLILGSVVAGTAFNTLPRTGYLQFEVRSEEDGLAAKIRDQVVDICGEISAEMRVSVSLIELARRKVGGIGFQHPLVKGVHAIMDTLGVTPNIGPSTGELSALISEGIPGVTLGITNGENPHEFNESAEIEPIFKGIAQLVATVVAMDKGLLDE
ncbi:MAG: M20/M25/M40 family metallo-hydrolase [Verrucomicrobiota bacterium]